MSFPTLLVFMIILFWLVLFGIVIFSQYMIIKEKMYIGDIHD